MRKVRQSGEAEMVAVFLRGELASPRFGAALAEQLRRAGLSRRLVTDPDLSDAAENARRRHLLAACRGYGADTGLFDRFPAEVRWERVALTPTELGRVEYIDYDYWVELSGGSRLASDAAARVSAGIEVFGVANEGTLAVAAAVAAGSALPELILVTARRDGGLVVLEGHVRLTAYMLCPDAIPDELEVLVGYAPAFTDWPLYGHP
jgi:hypothetical protein